MIRLLFVALYLTAATNAEAQDWEVVWADEFDYSGQPDPEKWNYDIGGHGWGNQEWQYYTNRLDNARVEDGVLIIEAAEEAYEGNDYTSARLVTRGTAAWQYGRIEARIKLPIGQGIWPAFWMLPTNSPYGGWPTGGEIDIMEYLGHEPSRVHGTLHYGGGSLGHRFTGTSYDLPTGTFHDDFHTFAIEWEPREIRWYVDDVHYQTQVSWSSAAGPYPAPFDHPFHLLLNVAVGGQWPGYPDETTTFPQQMLVDYVRVYEDLNARPEITLDAPSNGAHIESGGTLSLAATATDDGEILSVTFLQGGGTLGISEESPYTLTIDGVMDGCYTVSARAADDGGYSTASDTVSITVGAGCPEGSRSPYLMVPITLPGPLEAEYYDLGGGGTAYLDLSESNDGTGIRQDEGVDTRPSRDDGGGHDVTEVIAREWLTYTVDVEHAGMYRIMGRVASASGGTLKLSIDRGDLLGDASFPGTGGDETYGNVLLGTADLPAGRYILRIDIRSAGFSLNRLTFSYLGDTAAEDETSSHDLGLTVAPNPASEQAAALIRLTNAAPVTISLYDALGRRVRQLPAEFRPAGEHTVAFDVGDLAPGYYVCVLEAGGANRSTHLIIVR